MFKNLSPERKHTIKIIAAQAVVTAITLVAISVIEKAVKQ